MSTAAQSLPGSQQHSHFRVLQGVVQDGGTKGLHRQIKELGLQAKDAVGVTESQGRP